MTVTEQATMTVWLEQFENSNAMIKKSGDPVEIFCKSCVVEQMALEGIYLQNKEDVFSHLEGCAHGGFIPEVVLHGTCGECGKPVNP